MTNGIKSFLNGVEESAVIELVKKYDVDGDGNISLAEFTQFLLSRNATNPEEWLTVDTISGGRANALQQSYEFNHNDNATEIPDDFNLQDPEAIQYAAKIYLQKLKADLVARARKIKSSGAIPMKTRLSMQSSELIISIARSLIDKEFASYKRSKGAQHSSKVDFPSFSRVLDKFLSSGSGK